MDAAAPTWQRCPALWWQEVGAPVAEPGLGRGAFLVVFGWSGSLAIPETL